MTYSFQQYKGLIIVEAAILGTKADDIVRFCLDTGAERTTLSEDLIQKVGLQPPTDAEKFTMNSAGGKVSAPFVVLPKIFALGALKENFPVYVHTLPVKTPIDGLLGLDFMRGHVLNLDFRMGEITFD